MCFNALHGTFGEDGEVQNILENLSYKYTHSNSKASSLAFDKELSKKIVQKLKIFTPNYLVVDFSQVDEDFLLKTYLKLGSYIVKPTSSGSSYGTLIFKNKKSIYSFIKNFQNNIKIYKNHKKLLFEKYIEGRELTVSVIEKNNLSMPIEVTEIITKNIFFDYQAKYSPGFAKHILPAKLPNEIYEKCKFYAKKIHDKINCSGISRTDFIFSDNKIYFLEINTQPGLTNVSLLPEQLRYQNISFDDLVKNIIYCAL